MDQSAMNENVDRKFSLKKLAWGTLGFVLLTLGIIGRILPFSPWGSTGPIVGAAYCFSRSSERLERWLMSVPFFGDYIRHYRYKTGVRTSVKIISVTMMWIGMSIGIFFAPLLWVQILLAVLGLALTWHILSLKAKNQSVVIEAAAATE